MAKKWITEAEFLSRRKQYAYGSKIDPEGIDLNVLNVSAKGNSQGFVSPKEPPVSLYNPNLYNNNITGSSTEGLIPNAAAAGYAVQGASDIVNLGMAIGNKPRYIKHDASQFKTPGPITTTLNTLNPEEEIRQVKTAFSGARKDLRGNMSGALAAAGAQSGAVSGVYDKYNQANTNIKNQEKQLNYSSLSQYLHNRMLSRMQQLQDKRYVEDYNTRERDAYLQNINTGINNIGNTGAQFGLDYMAYDNQNLAYENLGTNNYRMIGRKIGLNR